jgi:uncharacterized transporter YbjL
MNLNTKIIYIVTLCTFVLFVMSRYFDINVDYFLGMCGGALCSALISRKFNKD